MTGLFNRWAYRHPRLHPAWVPWALCLWPISLVFGLGVSLRRLAYHSGLFQRGRLPAPVVAIGGLTVGGSGKSPVAGTVARLLLDQGHRVAILSRGYGRATRAQVVVCDGQQVLATPDQAGDEPVMLARQLGARAIVVVDRNRRAGARTACKQHGAQVLVLDDAGQHYQAQRDLDIIVLDPTNPFGNGQLLPAGPLRERPSRLKTADIVWWHGSEHAQPPTGTTYQRQVRSSYRLTGLRDLCLRDPGANQTLLAASAIKGQALLAATAIARPWTFTQLLIDHGLRPRATLIWPDHHRYTQADVARLAAASADNDGAIVVTTAKDAAKLNSLALPKTLRVLVAEVEVAITAGEDVLQSALATIMTPSETGQSKLPCGQGATAS